MLVNKSSVALESYSEYQRSQQNLNVIIEDGRIVDDGTNSGQAAIRPLTSQESFQLKVSLYARSLFNAERNGQKIDNISAIQPLSTTSEDQQEASKLGTDSRFLILKKLLVSLTGESFDQKTFQPPTAENSQAITPAANSQIRSALPSSGRFQVGVSLIQEYQYTEVSMSSSINLADGTSIELSMSITMERSYQQTTLNVVREPGVLQDPLAISFNGQSVSLSSSATFQFDLNSDGQAEQLAALNSNAGFIALDRNNDGVINNGSELFGAQSGNGFADLSTFDEDGNGFIDSGDSVFNKLFAFNPSSGLLSKLVDLGIGALYTSSVDSPFKLNDSNNRNLGAVRSSGFYLNEDRSAGLLQQVDLRS
jgi:hypothetical protein